MIDKISNSLPQVNEKNRKFVLIGIMGFVFFIYYFVIMQPQLSTLRTINPEIMIITQDLQKVKDDVNRMAQYRKQVEDLKTKITKVGGGIKSKEDVPKILERISLVANKHRIRIDQMMPLVENQEVILKNNEGKYVALPILVDGHGGYHDFARFVYDIEEKDASLKIDRFTLTANSEDMLKHTIKLTINAILLEPAGESTGEKGK